MPRIILSQVKTWNPRSIFFFFFLIFGPHLAVLRAYSCSILRDHSWQGSETIQGARYRALVCHVQGKHWFAVLSLQPPQTNFSGWKSMRWPPIGAKGYYIFLALLVSAGWQHFLPCISITPVSASTATMSSTSSHFPLHCCYKYFYAGLLSPWE